jgi:hypothetical protein
MRRAFISSLLLAGLLSACSKNEEQKPVSPTPAPKPGTAILPPKLTVTNISAATTPVATADYPKIEKGIEVKGAGNLYFTFPKSWVDKLARVQERGRWFDSIQFYPRTDKEFELMVNVNNVGQSNADNLDIKAILERAGKGELTNAVEKSLDIHELQGPQITGCYFVVTDKNRTIAAPKPGQYLYLTQGYAKTGGLVLSFRLVSNRLVPEQEQMLEMIKTVRFERK